MTVEISERILEIALTSKGKARLAGPIKDQVYIPETLGILELGDNRPVNHGQFSILTPKDGDKRVVWDRLSLAQIRDAKKMFNDLISKGLVPYKVGLDGKQSSEVMREFDPSAEEVVFVPVALVVGG